MVKQSFTLRTWLLLIVFTALATWSGPRFYEHLQYSWATDRNGELHKPVLSYNAHNIVRLRRILFNHGGAFVASPPKAANWQRSEQARVSGALTREKYDYIVLPLEQDRRYYDRVTRLMAARWVAEALRQATQKRVMSPELALRALGDRARRFDDDKVRALAARVGAHRVVHILLHLQFPRFRTKTETSRNNDGRLSFVVTDDSGKILKSFYARFHDNGKRPAEMLFADMAPTVIAALARPLPQSPALPNAAAAGFPDLPKHISGLPTAAASPLDNAVYLQFVAMLTPSRMQYERRRLFERSLLALHHVNASSPYYNLLTARAMFYLYRRPTALTFLSSARTPAERALREYLNGNYPEMAKLVPKIKDHILRAMALIELKAIGYAYTKSAPGHGIAIVMPTPQWSALITSAERDGDIWYAPDNVRFFAGIKGLFPAFDRQFESALNGQVTSGAYNSEGINLNLFHSIFKRAFATGGCCAHYDNRLEMADIWSLYRNITVANLLRQLDRETDVYGAYTTAKTMAADLQPWLDGNPNFMALNATTLYYYAQQVTGDERTFILKKARDMAIGAMAYSGGIDLPYFAGFSIWQQLGQTTNSAGLPPDGATCIWTRTCDFPSSRAVDARRNIPDALAYDNTKFSLLTVAAEKNYLDDAAVKRELKTRFDGAPEKLPYLADRLIHSGHEKRATELLQRAIGKSDTSWKTYRRLGDLLIDKGEFAGASRVFMKFPDFADPPPHDEVSTGNRAYYAGRKLFWLGRYKEAIPLYKIAANLDTGAGTQYAATRYLALVKGDYRTVLLAAYRDAQRYNSAKAFRDYLTVLSLVGLHNKAQAAFRTLAPRFSSPYLWKALYVDQRIQNQSPRDMENWVKEYLANSSDAGQSSQAVLYLMRQTATDRTPSLAAVKAVGRMETRHEHTTPDPRGGKLAVHLHLKIPGLHAPCPESEANCPGATPKGAAYANDIYAGFLYGYTMLRKGQCARALNAFLQFDKYVPLIERGEATPALPYFAMALSGTHQPQALAALAAMVPPPKDGAKNGFYDGLTHAVIGAALGRSDDSLNALVVAYRHRPRRVWAPLDPSYELVQVTQWLYDKTGDTRFLAKALKWAKEQQAIQPQDSWAYAFVARYGRHRAERVRSAAFAEYLDPRSAWLAKVPKSIRHRARSWWPKHNPFTIRTEQATSHEKNL